MKRFSFFKTLTLVTACVAALASGLVSASDTADINIELTREQRSLLNGQSRATPANYDMNSLNASAVSPVTLLSLQFTAETNPMKGHSLELGATYRAWSFNPLSVNLDRSTLATTITLQAPLLHALDFSHSIREKVELCPEKIIDKMIIDGAVGFNFSW
jgi:hypothetical protein